MWLLDERKVVISRSVVFHEELLYKVVKKDTSEVSRVQTVSTVVDLKALESKTEQEATTPEEDNVKEDSEEVVEQEVADYQLARDRGRRISRPPPRLMDYECDITDGEDQFAGIVCLMTEDTLSEPNSWKEAMMDADSDKWLEAAQDEMTSVEANETWELIERPKGQKTIGCRWLFKRKAGIAGVEPPRYKGRLVAKGYSQKEGIDYQEIFAPVVKHVSIRYILSAVAHFDMELQQMDVKTAFLHGNLDEFIVMEQPEGFVDKRYPDRV